MFDCGSPGLFHIQIVPPRSRCLRAMRQGGVQPCPYDEFHCKVMLRPQGERCPDCQELDREQAKGSGHYQERSNELGPSASLAAETEAPTIEVAPSYSDPKLPLDLADQPETILVAFKSNPSHGEALI